MSPRPTGLICSSGDDKAAYTFECVSSVGPELEAEQATGVAEEEEYSAAAVVAAVSDPKPSRATRRCQVDEECCEEEGWL